MKFIFLLIPIAMIGGWIYLFKYVSTKAREQNIEGEEFRTGRPPTWRIVLYCLIAVAIPLYFTYPKLSQSESRFKILFAVVILLLPAYIILLGVVLPAFLKKHKA